jgi:ABC-type hemin transport system ATPase subunit
MELSGGEEQRVALARSLAALGVRAPEDMHDGASLGLSARTGRYAARLERTARCQRDLENCT